MIGKQSFGWLPDYPDFRDYTTEHSAVNHLLSRIGVDKSLKGSLPASADLRAWCPPVEDQGPLGSCTANAGVGMIGYFERRAFGKYIEGSRLFLYKVTRNLLHSTGDRGVFLRSTMGALVLFEVPPEEYWPHITADYHKEPTPFC